MGFKLRQRKRPVVPVVRRSESEGYVRQVEAARALAKLTAALLRERYGRSPGREFGAKSHAHGHGETGEVDARAVDVE